MAYDPFAAGPFEVASRAIEAHDTARDRNATLDGTGRSGPASMGAFGLDIGRVRSARISRRCSRRR